jgi:hypothetical protein
LQPRPDRPRRNFGSCISIQEISKICHPETIRRGSAKDLNQKSLQNLAVEILRPSLSEGLRMTRQGVCYMCRNIKTLYNFDPPVTPEEVRAASLQFVRKITGFNKPSKANEAAFLRAIDEIANVSLRLLQSLETGAPPKNREEEAAKAKLRSAERFGT